MLADKVRSLFPAHEIDAVRTAAVKVVGVGAVYGEWAEFVFAEDPRVLLARGIARFDVLLARGIARFDVLLARGIARFDVASVVWA